MALAKQSGQISINSDEVGSIASSLNSTFTNLESEVSSKLPGNFSKITSLGFFSSGLTKLKQQASSISDTGKTIANMITEHVGDVADEDETLAQQFETGLQNPTTTGGGSRGGSGGGGGGGGYGGGGSPQTTMTDPDPQDDDKKINKDKLLEKIKAYDKDDKKRLIKLLNLTKGKDVRLCSLLFNSEYAEVLYKLLKKAYGETDTSEVLTEADYKEVQKELLKTILKEDYIHINLEDNSILIVKEYLTDISKKNKIELSDLILDDQYKDILKTSLKNVYNGKDVDNVPIDVIANFKSYVDKVAKLHDISSDDVINLHIEYLL